MSVPDTQLNMCSNCSCDTGGAAVEQPSVCSSLRSNPFIHLLGASVTRLTKQVGLFTIGVRQAFVQGAGE